ncbi:hypothetical protein [Enterococcus cecorum]|uniref:hypothetical protein n=1 Tax=Enterococcus cecorum TaxID=44008 RepID=UPI00148BC44B|nr:hypothetical protein [Enterococcus cecorum]
MMKAWLVENTRDYDYFDWNEIIFADNYKQARKLSLQTELYETSEDFVHMRVRRYPDMDDTENLNRKEFEYKLWQSGWMWEDMYQLTPYDEYEDESKAREDFLKWYRLNYEGSEEE